MYIKIYFDDRPLFLCDEMTDEIRAYAHHDDAVLIDEFSPHAVNAMIHEMRRPKVHAGIFIHSDLALLKDAIWKKFTVILAGGGLVVNDSGQYLFMLRRGKWDLPKGKLDEGETIEECAAREVEEETGLKKISLESPLLMTWHTYDDHGHHILKESHWFNMKAVDGQAIQPQLEEQITELRWVKPEQMGVLLQNTFPSIVDVIKAAGLSF